MLRRFSANYALFFLWMDLLCLWGAFVWARYLGRTCLSQRPIGDLGAIPYWVYGSGVLLWLLVALVASLYDPQHTFRAVDEFQRVGLAILGFVLALAGLLYFSQYELPRSLVLYFAALQALMLFGWRAGARVVFRLLGGQVYPQRRVLIVGVGQVGRQVAEMIETYAWTGLQLVGYLDDNPEQSDPDQVVLGRIADIRSVVQDRDIDDAVLALSGQAHEQVNDLVMALHDLPVQVRIVPNYFSLALYRAAVEEFGGLPLINLRAPALNGVQRLIKRAFDLLIGMILTILFLPLMALVAIAIRLDSPGPAIFRQQRVGENCRLFEMYKFRSMVQGAESLQEQVNHRDENGCIVHKTPCDPRVTRVGYWLRRSSLDELPQLFNVLKGEMSLVGPRPELPWLVEHYEPWQRRRFSVPQGLTGWWQVNGRSDRLMHLHTEDDLYYIQNYSLFLDLLILWRTVWVVLKGRGAY